MLADRTPEADALLNVLFVDHMRTTTGSVGMGATPWAPLR